MHDPEMKRPGTELNTKKALELFEDGSREGGCCTQCQAECWEAIEPDAARVLCEECGARRVLGIENYFLTYLPL